MELVLSLKTLTTRGEVWLRVRVETPGRKVAQFEGRPPVAFSPLSSSCPPFRDLSPYAVATKMTSSRPRNARRSPW